MAWPCQDGIADAFTDPAVSQITVKKSARVGYSKIVQNFAGYCIDQAPARLLIYQPTVEDAELYAKDDLSPVLNWPVIRRRVVFKPRDPNNQIRAKRFPGGWIQIKGANSPKEFRRITADKVLLEEPDGYPPMAGKSGDQAALAFKRCLTSDEPLRAAGSTPLIDGSSKIDALFREGTQEYRYMPCPHCGLYQRLVFGDGTGLGIRWEPKERPTRAWYRCEAGCDIDEAHKAAMDRKGDWRAHAPENFPHRSFHLWAGYSQFDGAAWLVLAKEFLGSRKDPRKLQTFVNETLGETWTVRGEAPEWRRLYDRREEWDPSIVPQGGLVLTAGIDVQGNRIEAFVWAWGQDKQSWLIEHRVIDGNPFQRAVWGQVSEVVQGSWQHASGVELRLSRVGVDTGFATTQVEAWSRRHLGLVIPVKGASSNAAPMFAWSDVREAGARGGKRKRGMRHGMVGGHITTLELYGYLGLNAATEQELAEGVPPYPPGYVHLSQAASEEVCKQLVGDQWVEARGEWKKVHATEALDGWKYARAVANATGLDRWTPAQWRRLAATLQATEPAAAAPGNKATQEPSPPAEAAKKADQRTPQRRVGRSSYMGRIGR